MPYYISTMFENDKPSFSSIVTPSGKMFKFTLFKKETGTDLYTVFKRINKIKEIIENNKVVLNNFKSYLDGFKMSKSYHYDVYDVGVPRNANFNEELKSIIKNSKSDWQMYYANAQRIYSHLQDRGIYMNGEKVYPTFNFTTTGRSSTSGPNVLSATDGDDLYLGGFKYYIHFDWIAADIRMSAIMSEDDELDKYFDGTDPYTAIASELGGDVNRNDIKGMFLPSIYALDFDNPLFDLFPKFKNWVVSSLSDLEHGKHISSYDGRKFKSDNYKSVFSGMIQGSVAHAMHRCLLNIFEGYPENILIENHDSITMMCNESKIKGIIDVVKDIMLRPFGDDGPVMPIRVYIGTKFRDWKLYKAYYE
jgi:hypothetical protein